MKAILFCVPLSGCMSLPADPAKMSAEQLKAWATDKNANVACTVINSPYGRGVTTFVTLDKGIVIDGTVTVDSECKVNINSNKTNTKKE